jgi:hypothetical protein
LRTFLSITGICAALVMCGVSAAMNYLFMASLGKTPLEGHVLGAASAAADVLKALLPFFIAWSWAAGRIMAAASGTLAFLFFAGFSLLSAIGFAADNRGVLVDGREGLSGEYNRVLRQAEEAVAAQSALPAHRPATVVNEEIEAHRQNRRWGTTKECANATEAESRAFCSEYFRLRAELAAANESERLAEDIAALQAESANLRADGAGLDSDPQVSLLSRITGQKPEPVRLALTIAVALLVEIGASLGLFLASGHRLRSVQADPRPAKPAGCVEEFCLEALISAQRSSLAMDDIHRAYEAWCADKDLAALDVESFCPTFAAIAHAIGLSHDSAGYSGIALAPVAHAKAA